MRTFVVSAALCALAVALSQARPMHKEHVVPLKAGQKSYFDVQLVKVAQKQGQPGYLLPDIFATIDESDKFHAHVCAIAGAHHHCYQSNGSVAIPSALYPHAAEHDGVSFSIVAQRDGIARFTVDHKSLATPQWTQKTKQADFAVRLFDETRGHYHDRLVTNATPARTLSERRRAKVSKESKAKHLSAQTGFEPLKFGESQTFSVSDIAKFELPFDPSSAGDKTVSIDVTSIISTVDVFVTFCKETACSDSTDPSANPTFSASGPDASVVFSMTDLPVTHACSNTQSCVAQIAAKIHGNDGWAMALIEAQKASFDSSILPLGQQVIEAITAAPGKKTEPKYYYIDTPRDANVRISVTPIDGDVDLFVSFTSMNPKPSKARNDGSSESTHLEMIDINKGSCHDQNHCYYFITVKEYFGNNCTFAILATTDGTGAVELDDGVPLGGSVLTGVTNHYKFVMDAQSGNRDLTVTLDPYQGDAELFVNFGALATKQNHTAESRGIGSEMLYFGATTDNWPEYCKDSSKACTMYIGVYGFIDSSYDVMVSLDGGSKDNIKLMTGVPQEGRANRTEGSFFVFTPSGDVRVPIQFVLTPLEGDPDMYLSTCSEGAGCNRPDSGHHNWSSLNSATYDDVLVIYPSDPKYIWGDPIHVGVFGFFAECRFSLLVTQGAANYTVELTPGLPQIGSALTDSLSYYTFKTPSDIKDAYMLKYSLENLQGNSRLYIARGSSSSPKTPQLVCLNVFWDQCTEWGLDPNSYDVEASEQDGMLVATIGHSDVVANTFYTGIVHGYGLSNANNFYYLSLVTPSGSSITTLEWNHDVAGHVKSGEAEYFMVELSEANKDIVIQAHSEDIIDLHVDTDPAVIHPSTSAQFNAGSGWNSFGIARVFIKSSQLNHTCENRILSGEGCQIHIAVTSAYDVDFSIHATYSDDPTNPRPLPMVSPIMDFVSGGHYDYFSGSIQIVESEAIHINMITLFGDADLYVNVGPNKAFPRKGEPSDYTLFGLGPGEESLSIYSTDYNTAGECPCTSYPCECPIRISVHGYHANHSFYEFDVQTSNTIVPVQANGQYVGGSVHADATVYFRVDLTPQQMGSSVDFLVDVSVSTGSAAIVANVDDGKAPPTLPEYPDTHVTWKTDPTGGSATLRVAPQDPNSCQSSLFAHSCAYLIGVHASSEVECDFMIRARIQQVQPNPSPGASPAPQPHPTVTRLLDGQEISDVVAMGHFMYFYFDTVDYNGVKKITFDWDVVAGPQVELYFWNDYNPRAPRAGALDPAVSCFSSSQLMAGTSAVTFSASSGHGCYRSEAATYTVGVKGLHPDSTAASNVLRDGTIYSSFNLLAFTNTTIYPVQLQPGQQTPQFWLAPGDIMYFSLRYPSEKLDVSIESENANGDVFIYVNNNASVLPKCSGGQSSRCHNYVWSNNNFPDQSIFVNHSAPCSGKYVHTSNCQNPLHADATWIVAVFAYSQSTSSFRLSYHLGSSPMRLEEGTPYHAATTKQPVCPARDSEGHCIGDPSTIRHKSVAFFSFFPSVTEHLDMLGFLIRKDCGSSCDNEPPLLVAVTACVTCAGSHRFPLPSQYGGSDNILDFSVPKDARSVNVPSTQLRCGTSNCAYYIGVYSDNTAIGQTSSQFSILATTGNSITYIGKIEPPHTLPPSHVVNSNPNVYDVFTVSLLQSAQMHVRLVACEGATEFFACDTEGPQRCPNNPTRPGPQNTVVKSKFENGVASADFTASGDVYVAVKTASSLGHRTLLRTSGARKVMSLGTPSAYLWFSAGDAQVLEAPSAGATAHVHSGNDDDDGLVVQLSWDAPTIVQGTQKTTAKDIIYTAFLVRYEDIEDNMRLDTVCGLHTAFQDVLGVKGYSDRTDKLGIDFAGVPPGVTYYAVIAAECSGSECETPLEAAYPWTKITTSNGPAKHHDHHSGPAAGPIVGGIFGALIGIALIGGAIWYFRRRTQAQVSSVADDGFYSDSVNYQPM